MHARKIVIRRCSLRIDFLTNSEIYKANKYQLFLSQTTGNAGQVRVRLVEQILLISEQYILELTFRVYFPTREGYID